MKSSFAKILAKQRFEQARKEVDRLIYRLLRSTSQEALRLAETIESCTAMRPCGSGACALCTQEQQDEVVTLTDELADNTRSPIYFVTILLKHPPLGRGQLHEYTHRNHVRLLNTALRKLPVDWALLSLDISLSEDSEGQAAPEYVLHFHGLIATEMSKEEIHRVVKASKKLSRRAKKPLKVELWDRNPDAIRYSLKTFYLRRIGYHGSRFNKSSQKIESCKNTRYDKLRVSEQIEIALAFHKIGMTSRIVLKNIRLAEHPDGKRLQFRRRKRVKREPVKVANERSKPPFDRLTPDLSKKKD